MAMKKKKLYSLTFFLIKCHDPNWKCTSLTTNSHYTHTHTDTSLYAYSICINLNGVFYGVYIFCEKAKYFPHNWRKELRALNTLNELTVAHITRQLRAWCFHSHPGLIQENTKEYFLRRLYSSFFNKCWILITINMESWSIHCTSNSCFVMKFIVCVQSLVLPQKSLDNNLLHNYLQHSSVYVEYHVHMIVYDAKGFLCKSLSVWK